MTLCSQTFVYYRVVLHAFLFPFRHSWSQWEQMPLQAQKQLLLLRGMQQFWQLELVTEILLQFLPYVAFLLPYSIQLVTISFFIFILFLYIYIYIIIFIYCMQYLTGSKRCAGNYFLVACIVKTSFWMCYCIFLQDFYLLDKNHTTTFQMLMMIDVSHSLRKLYTTMLNQYMQPGLDLLGQIQSLCRFRWSWCWLGISFRVHGVLFKASWFWGLRVGGFGKGNWSGSYTT